MLNTSVGNFRVIRLIGEGGMGAVYLARHVMLDRAAAVKVLLPELSNNREIVARFFNEARAASAIRHPGIVEVHDFGFLPDSRAYILMELLEGEGLGSRLRRLGPLAPATALVFARQIAGALHAAHERGIIHRDLKPDNIFLVNDPELPGGERIKLLDFGIAKLTSGAGSRTLTHAVMGTPAYMSPEQCRSTADVDGRADLYSLGCVLYELVCGRPPFVGDDTLAQQLHARPQPPSAFAPGLPEPIERLTLWLLEKDPSARPATAVELVAAIDHAAAAIVDWPGVAAAVAPTAVVPASSTTMGSAAGARVTGAATRRPWWLVPTTTGVLMIGAVAVWFGARQDRRSAAEDDPVPAAPAPAVAIDAAPQPAPDAAPAAPPDAAPEPASVRLYIDSDPPGASVLFDGRVVGTTPFADAAIRDSGQRVYMVRKRGFQASRITIDTDGDRRARVVLRKKRAACAAPIGSAGDRGVDPFCE